MNVTIGLIHLACRAVDICCGPPLLSPAFITPIKTHGRWRELAQNSTLFLHLPWEVTYKESLAMNAFLNLGSVA